MSVGYAILISLGICLIAALLEGLFAGKNVKSVLIMLQTPSFAPPLWAWAIIGIGYYAICFFVLFRIFKHKGDDSIKTAALVLLLIVMAVNAFWNSSFLSPGKLILQFRSRRFILARRRRAFLLPDSI